MHHTHFHKFLFLLLSLFLMLAACAAPAPVNAPQAPNGEEPLVVVATYSILGDLVTKVGGEHLQVITLVGPNGDAHTFEPTPADSVALTQAALIFENGLAFEPWLDELYSASGATAQRVVVSEGIELLASSEEEEHDHTGEAEHDETHGEFDPHIWHSVRNAMQMVENIRGALVAADPDHADAYAANAERYLAELTELQEWVQEQVATLPAERRKLVTSHDTFGYFAAAYGFEIIGTAVGAASTEAADPSARELAELVERVKAEAIPAIFAENVANPQLIEQIAEETGAVVGAPLYTDALGAAGSDGDSYIKLMRYNVEKIVSALQK